jgi:hypothetical protein
MKQRAIRERRNHKPQDARRFNCRLNCGPTRTYATTLEATRPSLSRALPISSLALAALLAIIARYTLLATLRPVCLAHLMHSLTFRCPKQNHIPASATSSHMAVQNVHRLPKAAIVVNNNPPRATVFLLLRIACHLACTLAKTESVCPHVAGVASPQTLPKLTQCLDRNLRSCPLTRNAARSPSLLSKLEAPCPSSTASKLTSPAQRASRFS